MYNTVTWNASKPQDTFSKNIFEYDHDTIIIVNINFNNLTIYINLTLTEHRPEVVYNPPFNFFPSQKKKSTFHLHNADNNNWKHSTKTHIVISCQLRFVSAQKVPLCTQMAVFISSLVGC